MFNYHVYRPNQNGTSESCVVSFEEEWDVNWVIDICEEDGDWEEDDWDDMNHSDEYRVEVNEEGSSLWMVVNR